MMPEMKLSASSSATATSKGGDGAFGGSTSAMNQGDWNINYGSGGVSTSSVNWVYVGIAVVGVMWLMRQRKA